MTLIRAILVVALLGVSALVQAAFVVGVPPIHSMRTLAERYEPLRVFLEARLGQPVFLASGTDFIDYHERTLKQTFDLTITPAHLARVAQIDQNFKPVAQFSPDHDALLVTRDDRPLTQAASMRGQALGVIDELAVTVMASQDYLGRAGLEPGKDYKVSIFRNHASVAHAVVTGMARAGVTTTQGLKLMPAETRARLRVHAHIADIPAFVLLARPSAAPEQVTRLHTILMEVARSKTGQDFLKSVANQDLRPVDDAALQRTDAYMKRTRKALAR